MTLMLHKWLRHPGYHGRFFSPLDDHVHLVRVQRAEERLMHRGERRLFFFQGVNNSSRTDLQPPCRIAAPTAIETPIDDLVFDRRGTSFVEEIELKAVRRAGGILALIALLTRFGLAAFDDLVTVTVGTKHGNAYHGALLLKPSAAWHTCG